MPKVKEKTASTRRTRTSSPLSIDEKFMGTEPVWDTQAAQSYDDATFDALMRKSLNWYNYFYTTKTTKKYVLDWARKHTELDAKTLNAFDRSADKFTSMTACGLAMAHRRGMPFRQRHVDFLVKHINQVVAKAAAVETPAVETPVVKPEAVISIQDRLNEKLSEYIGELEGRLDDAVVKKSDRANAIELMKALNVPQALVRRIRTHFETRLTEFKELQVSKDAYVKESYRHFKAADWRRVVAWLEGLLQDCDSYGQVKKAARKPRAPKAVSREKIVSKLKYLKEDTALKIVSIKPTDIIGAKEFWCFNTQTRKLCRYIADAQVGSLGVKNNSIVGFDTAKSVCKTLRKPSEQLKEFAKAGKVALRTFLDKIRATETQVNGRMNDNMLLLKVL
jgi:hypothetical protein